MQFIVVNNRIKLKYDKRGIIGYMSGKVGDEGCRITRSYCSGSW